MILSRGTNNGHWIITLFLFIWKKKLQQRLNTTVNFIWALCCMTEQKKVVNCRFSKKAWSERAWNTENGQLNRTKCLLHVILWEKKIENFKISTLRLLINWNSTYSLVVNKYCSNILKLVRMYGFLKDYSC